MEQLFKSSNLHNLIKSDLSNHMLNHGYLLTGNDSSKLNAFAKYMAMQILCETNNACGKCNQCIKVFKNEHADVVILPRDKKMIVTEDIDKIVDESYILPLEAEKKIYILNNFDGATIQAQNKLLKTLEEPPKSVVFILTSTSEHNVLDTIKSRCKKISLPACTDQEIIGYIDRNYPNKNARDLLEIVDGSITNLQRAIIDSSVIKMKDLCIDIINNFKNSSMTLSYSVLVQEFDTDIEMFFETFIDELNRLMKDVINNNSGKYDIASYTPQAIKQITDLAILSISKIKGNGNMNAIVDGFLLGILEVKYKCKK